MEKVLKLGIWGISGIGKTTIAKAVYNQIYVGFEAASFVSNVRATATEATGLTKLQKQILKDLINYGEEVDDVDKGKSLFRDRLGGRRVLLILDDVDDRVHLKALVGDWLGPGSRAIITSRNQHILNVARADCIHEMSGLDIYEGLQLFSWHAFLRASPHPSFEDLSKGIVEVCRGHPLSLEVIGSFLYDKQDNRGCWDEALRNITSNPDIYDRLYISYSALSDDEKEIFVDIACFFIGELQQYPFIFWKSLYDMVETAICNLSMKLLIKIDDEGGFDMHDHLRDMGRTIAERGKKGTRLWGASRDSSIIPNNITHLQLKGGNMQRLELLYRPGLRYLCLQNMGIGGMTKDTLAMLPPSLIWLRLEHCQYAAGMNRVKKKPRHSRFVGNIWQLKTLQITFSDDVESHHISSLFSLPNIRLQHLNLRWCTNLNKLPDTIGNLSQLQNLDLERCTNLNKLPDIIGNLSQLQNLDLRRCTNLNKLPDTTANLSQLQKLNLEGCSNLSNLPDTIGNLSQLQNLYLLKCTNLSNLADIIGNLSQLQNLYLWRCTNLSNLPDTIGNLLQLQNLDLGVCTNLSNLPDTIGNLSQLQNLDLGECINLSNLPDTIGNLSQLQKLNLEGCTNLSNLPDTIGNLSQLQKLNLEGCTNLSNLPELQNLYLWRCTNLSNLPDTIDNLSQLQNLYLWSCTNLSNLPDTIGNLSQCRTFFLR
ncbi:disease resistance protein TAO1-like [Cryptomeria japonica]|uniref:disease resistance protein TAO1-like n=1 Tax=Cryptomeria japonica TaxID=3369 RepID=UPI0027DA5993|nr:disease resistance protein TAO1-like [Cryptomeria japonica]